MGEPAIVLQPPWFHSLFPFKIVSCHLRLGIKSEEKYPDSVKGARSPFIVAIASEQSTLLGV